MAARRYGDGVVEERKRVARTNHYMRRMENSDDYGESLVTRHRRYRDMTTY
jgi:hypothetical protein